MEHYQLLCEKIMCIFWLITYIICIISSKKYKYIMISPATQVIFLSYELAFIIKRIYYFNFGLYYIMCIYLLWLLCEIIFIILIAKIKYKKINLLIYFESILGMLGISIYVMFFINYSVSYGYLIAIIGEILWLIYILRKDYPVLKINLLMFISKFLANLILMPTYFNLGGYSSRIICILLSVIDLVFIIIYAIKLRKGNKA